MENIKNLLITGGAGYIGSNTINTLFYLYPNINFVVVDLKKKPSYINKDIQCSKRFKYYEENIGNDKKMMKILKKNSISYIIDLAAFLPWDLAIVSDDKYITNNTVCRYNFFNTCVKYGKIIHYIYQSSILALTNLSDNYNGTKNIFLPEENQYDHFLYTTTKSAGYSFGYNTQCMKMLPITIVSPAHIYGGTNQHIEDTILFGINELCEKGKITLGRNSNTNYDNWINIYDVINGYQTIFNQGPNGKNYNLINQSQYYTPEQTAQMIIKYAKKTTDYSKYITYRPNLLTPVPNFKRYNIQSNFAPGQFNTTNSLELEIAKLASNSCKN